MQSRDLKKKEHLLYSIRAYAIRTFELVLGVNAGFNSGLKSREFLRCWAEFRSRPNVSFENTRPLRAGFPNGGGMKLFLKLLSPLFLLFMFALSVYEKGRPKIYDCVLFFNEPELLEIRLNELYESVDKFVIVETIENFQGKLKPLYFEENRHLFKKFEDKIIHIALKERVNTNDPWERKAFQRNQILRGLKQCRKQDIILFSDMDEIVKAKALKEIKSLLVSGKYDVVGTRQKKYTYFLNRFAALSPGTVATTAAYLKKATPQQLRRRKGAVYQIENAGWHFAHIGGIQRVLSKIYASAYADQMDEEKKDAQFLAQEMEKGVFEKIDETFPKYVQENEGRYREIG
ncbi:MAG: hypothetical protein A2098_03915, partial [Chlamydiae bacterium GWF2_49_8]